VVFGDLIADFVAPLLTVALKFLSVLNSAGTIFGHILGARASRTASKGRTGSNAGAGSRARSGGACRSRTGPGRKLRRRGPATALQEVGRGAAAGRTSPDGAGGSGRHVQEVAYLAGRRPGAGGDTCARRGPRCGTSASRGPRCSAGSGRRPCCRARSGRGPCRGARSACGPCPAAATYSRRTTSRGRGPRPAAPATGGASAPTAAATTAGKHVVLREKQDCRECQESCCLFHHVVTCNLF